MIDELYIPEPRETEKGTAPCSVKPLQAENMIFNGKNVFRLPFLVVFVYV